MPAIKPSKNLTSLLAIVALVLFAFSGIANRYLFNDADTNYAVIFAIENYESTNYKELKNPIDDAKKIAVELDKFDYFTEVVRNPTLEEIEAKLIMINEAYQNGDFDPKGQLLVFFTGHGEYDKRMDRGYFVPSDGSKDLRKTCLEYNYWRDYIDQILCQHILVVIDACYSGSFNDNQQQMRSGESIQLGKPTGIKGGEASLLSYYERKTRTVLCSGIDKTPDDSEFSKYFVAGLQENSSRNPVSILELYANYLSKANPTPVVSKFSSGDVRNDFLFFRAGEDLLIDPEKIHEFELWKWAQEDNTALGYNFYIKRYPAGLFTEEAKEKIATVQVDSPPLGEEVGQIIYVTPDGKRSGASWQNPASFQHALSIAKAGQEIWLAVGKYRPHSSDRNVSFEIPSGVKVRGGFAGSENSPNERQPSDLLTQLSGDIGEVDLVDDNSYTVVLFKNVSEQTLLEKVTISDGAALGFSRKEEPNVCGGAIFNDGSNAASNPVIQDCKIENNRARKGAGIYNYGENGFASPTIINCNFLMNHADFNGGAIYNDGRFGVSSPVISFSKFESNKSDYGGGVFNRGSSGISNPIITSCVFVNNFSLSTGSAIYNSQEGGGETNAVITDCTYLANDSTLGDDFDNTINNDGVDTLGRVIPKYDDQTAKRLRGKTAVY